MRTAASTIRLIPILLAALLPTTSPAQDADKPTFSIQRWAPDSARSLRIAFVWLDGRSSLLQTTIVEYDQFVVLLDLPAALTATRRARDYPAEYAQGAQLLHFIEAQFMKPIRAILASHWHAHSLSGIAPFLERGAHLYVTPRNWQAALSNGLLPDSIQAQRLRQHVTLIERDTTLLPKTECPIQVLHLDSATYTRKPTSDYLIFHLPRARTLHAACMADIKTLDYTLYDVAEYSDRLIDLRQAIRAKAPGVRHLIWTNFTAQPLFVIPRQRLEEVMRQGKSGEEMVEHFAAMRLPWLIQHQDSLLRYAIRTALHPNILRLAAYRCMQRAQHDQAVALARILCAYQPHRARYVDVLGECYYRMGLRSIADHYDAILKRMDTGYGLEQWAERLADQPE